MNEHSLNDSNDPLVRSLRTKVLELEAQAARDLARNQRTARESDKMLAELLTARKNVEILTGNVATLKALSVQLASQLEEANQTAAMAKEQDTIATLKRDRDVASELSALRIEYEGRLLDMGRELDQSTTLCSELQAKVKDLEEQIHFATAKIRHEKDHIISDLLARNDELQQHMTAYVTQAIKSSAGKGKGSSRGGPSTLAIPRDLLLASSPPHGSATVDHRREVPSSLNRRPTPSIVVRRSRSTAWSSTAESDSDAQLERNVLALNVQRVPVVYPTMGRSKLLDSGLAASTVLMQAALGQQDGQRPSYRFHVDVAADPAVLQRVPVPHHFHQSGEARKRGEESYDDDEDGHDATRVPLSTTAAFLAGFQPPLHSAMDSLRRGAPPSRSEEQQWAFETSDGVVIALQCRVTRKSERDVSE